MALHLIKLCVGCDTVEELAAWRRDSRERGEAWKLRTRQTPRRAPELLDGGSVYRVYRGHILSRQRILAVETVGAGTMARCEITLDEAIVRTSPAPRRAFQGWRYLAPPDAPADLFGELAEDDVPFDLAVRLRQLGAW